MRAGPGPIALGALLVAVSLQGCGKKPKPSPSPAPAPSPSTTTTTTTTTTVKRPPPTGWNLAPIQVNGSHLYDSVTMKQFHATGIGMPNIGEDIEEWIKVLRRINRLSPKVNTVRIYVLPTCALHSDCFRPFMREADKLGIYVLVPGTGTSWGWLPGSAGACGEPATAQGCYTAGGVLGFGQTVVQRFHYPNTLAIVIGNEFDMQMVPFIPLLKAYARDLKAYMAMCHRDGASPTRGRMRAIPLMYANSDDRGDPCVMVKADYLFCGNTSASIDIFGLNIERWCEDEAGKGEYSRISTWVEEKKYPGAFVFSEMGCAKINAPKAYGGARSWAEVSGFFTNFPGLDGFAAYTFWGNKDFDMFDGPFSNATEYKDGENFFSRLEGLGGEPDQPPAAAQAPDCPAEILGAALGDYREVLGYATGKTGLAPQCPKPYQNTADGSESAEFVV